MIVYKSIDAIHTSQCLAYGCLRNTNCLPDFHLGESALSYGLAIMRRQCPLSGVKRTFASCPLYVHL